MLVRFPFSDLTSAKLRPAEVGRLQVEAHREVVEAVVQVLQGGLPG